MIVPMQKYAFLVFYANYKEFLAELKKIGVVHIAGITKEPTFEMQEQMRTITEVARVIKRLDWFTPEKGAKELVFTNGESVYQRLKEIEKEQEHNQHHTAHLEKQYSQLEPWGNFEWEPIKKLEANGLKFRFLTCSAKKFQHDWELQYNIRIVDELAGYIYFVKIERQGEPDDEFTEIQGIEEVILPRTTFQQVNTELKDYRQQAKNLHSELENIAFYGKKQLNEYFSALNDDFQEMNAISHTKGQVDDKVQLLEGFVPETKKTELEHYLETNNILYIVSKPEIEEKVPILLKNNRFTKLYEVIGKLYDLPNHNELDLVPFFAPFYMMFFGFALGDAGYGILMLLGATIAKPRMPAMKDILSLVQWLGLATIIFGILTGTIFGINLLNLDIPFMENLKKYMIDTDKMFTLAIALGVIQILFGMVVKVLNIRKQQGIKYAASTIGWLILLIGSMVLYGLKSMQLIALPLAGIIQYVILGVAGVLIFLLNNPKRNVFINFAAGLWDTYGMTTSLLGDILSYIRLFALGVSTAILGSVFNQLALNMKPDVIILGEVVMVLILVAGHSITLFMAGLGAFVHPIRLTFVEFYKNAGFTGGGKPYKPFEQHIVKA